MKNINSDSHLQISQAEAFRQNRDQQIKELWNFSANQLLSVGLFRIVGYGLIVFSIIDVINLLIPANFTNPGWEMQTIGGLVERTPIPLLGIALVFYGGENIRKKWEKPVLIGISWLSLVIGIICFLMIPMGISNTIRLDRQNSEQINTAIEQRRSVIEQVNSAIEQANSAEAMQNLINRLASEGNAPKIESDDQITDIRNQMAKSIQIAERKIKIEAANTQRKQRIMLFKRSVKWNLGALISGMLFVITWKLTRWTQH